MYRTHAYRDVLECFSASEFATCLHARTFYANILWDAPFLTNSGSHEGAPLELVVDPNLNLHLPLESSEGEPPSIYVHKNSAKRV